MKFFVIIDESAFKYINSDEQGVLIINDNVTIPNCFEKFRTINLCEISEEEDKGLCSNFTRSYFSFSNKNCFDEFLLPHVNGIYEYVITLLYRVNKTINLYIGNNDEVVLLGGSRRILSPCYYGIKSAEFRRSTFINLSEVINPFLFQINKNKNKVTYREENYHKCLFRRIFRSFLLFTASYLLTFFKYFLRLYNEKNIKFECIFHSEKTLLFPLRSKVQCDLFNSVYKMFNGTGGCNVVPVYYEMLLGKPFVDYISDDVVYIISLFKTKLIPVLLVSPLNHIIGIFKGNMELCKSDRVTISLADFTIDFEMSVVLNENVNFPHLCIYREMLNKVVENYSLSRKEVVLCSTELIGIQTFLERGVALKNNVKFLNIQTVAASAAYYPVKVIGSKMFCLSSSDAINFNKKGINNFGESFFVGNLKYPMPTARGYCRDRVNPEKKIKNILFATQPYEQMITMCFLRELLLFAKPRDIAVTIRVHPRDDIDLYKCLDGVLFSPESENVMNSVEKCDLLLTRTSSVIYDAIALGKDYYFCHLSNFDLKARLAFSDENNYRVIRSFYQLSELLIAKKFNIENTYSCQSFKVKPEEIFAEIFGEYFEKI